MALSPEVGIKPGPLPGLLVKVTEEPPPLAIGREREGERGLEVGEGHVMAHFYCRPCLGIT